MIKPATLRSAWKVIVEPLSPILHILDETLHQIAAWDIVDVMLQTQRAARGRIPVSPVGVDWMAAITVHQPLQEKLSRQDVTRPREIEAQKEPSIRLECEPQPSLLASDLDPSLIDEEASNTTNREAIIEATEALNPTPDRDVTPRTDILQACGHSPQTQTLKIHIDRVEHHSEGSPLTFN